MKIMYDSDVDHVLFSTHLIWKYFNLVNPSQRRFGFTTDRLFMYCPVFYFQKKSVLKDILNEKLQIFRETGLTESWIRKYTDHRRTKLNQRLPEKLRIETISAPFEFCLIMHFLSFNFRKNVC